MLNEKSPSTAAILALFFGPLGMIYCSFGLGFLYFLVNCILAFSVVGIPFIVVTWFVGVLHAFSAANAHNSALKKLLNRQ